MEIFRMKIFPKFSQNCFPISDEKCYFRHYVSEQLNKSINYQMIIQHFHSPTPHKLNYQQSNKQQSNKARTNKQTCESFIIFPLVWFDLVGWRRIMSFFRRGACGAAERQIFAAAPSAPQTLLMLPRLRRNHEMSSFCRGVFGTAKRPDQRKCAMSLNCCHGNPRMRRWRNM